MWMLRYAQVMGYVVGLGHLTMADLDTERLAGAVVSGLVDAGDQNCVIGRSCIFPELVSEWDIYSCFINWEVRLSTLVRSKNIH